MKRKFSIPTRIHGELHAGQRHIYCVTLHNLPQGLFGTEYYSTIAAIFQYRTPEQLGVTPQQLYYRQLARGQPYVGAECTISREALRTKQRRGVIEGETNPK